MRVTAAEPRHDVGEVVGQYLLFTGRSVRRILRTPETVIATAGFPVILFLSLLAAFSTSVEAFEGEPYAQRLVPALLVSGLMFGSMGSAVGFYTDLNAGFMTRIRSLPVGRSGPLVGAALAETVRSLLATVVLTTVGFAFGFRFDGTPVDVALFIALGAVAAFSLGWVGLFMAGTAKSQETLTPPLSALFLILLFFSQGMVPLEGYPGWAQPLVRANPATAYVRALDAMARGDDVLSALVVALAWSVVLVLIFGTLAVRRLRAATA